MRTPEDLVATYVAAHNEGVRTHDFAPLAALLHPTASMRFRGVEAGPYDSAVAIVSAFREAAPTDELQVLHVRSAGASTAVATYAWCARPGRTAGRIRITVRGDLISAIQVEVFP